MLGAARRVCRLRLRAAVRFPPLLMAEPGTPRGAVLKDVVAYVEVWSANGTENYSKTFTNQLVEMGAKVSKTFSKRVTHVVFKDGYQRTWDRAQERGVKLVSVLWVERCRTAGAHADEALFPAARPPEHLPCLVRRKHKCMQPKDFTPKTPENDKRLQKKFEKMANELQRQKTTLEDDVPVLLFESGGSLVYSPTAAAAVPGGHHLAMEKRLREMKEKRENLSLTSSQMMENLDDDNSPCEASLNVSHDASCSDDSFAGGLQSSFDELCGRSGRGRQDRSPGGCAGDTRSAARVSAPAMGTSSAHPSASPPHRGGSTPRQPARPLPEGGRSGRKDPAGGAATPGAGPSGRGAKPCAEKCGPSPASPAPPGGRRGGRSRPGGSSAKRARASPRPESPPPPPPPPGGSPKRRRCSGKSPAPRLRLFQAEKPLQPAAGPAVEPPDLWASLYEDYFSPENLRERHSETLLPGWQSPSSPARFRGAVGLSKRERRSVLETSDFSCIRKSLTSTSADAASSPAPTGVQPDTPPGGVTPETPPAVQEAAGCGRRGEAQQTEGAGPDGTRCPCSSPCADPEPTRPPPARPGDATPATGGAGETRDSVGVSAGGPTGGPTPRALRPCEGAEDRPTRRGAVDGSPAGREDPSGPHEAPRRRGKGQKPTRTLVMTSLPPEKQSIVLQVVAKLKGFSVVREVCGSTTHVLAGQALRTLTVLLGLARGCWILSYEWVLWSLELGHWISEEPFELSGSFPAAPPRRRSWLLGKTEERLHGVRGRRRALPPGAPPVGQALPRDPVRWAAPDVPLAGQRPAQSQARGAGPPVRGPGHRRPAPGRHLHWALPRGEEGDRHAPVGEVDPRLHHPAPGLRL
ncbi:microcephalin isoform X2 [Phyllostomus hastatus]|uniref:microcephalin isoform X2 n=1 Tax=Phyllostomus hastatus TaxID=9423 RepID=UPI001E67F0A4|nr:microcephalin isoform X2 [Phyllostomus hastatus]